MMNTNRRIDAENEKLQQSNQNRSAAVDHKRGNNQTLLAGIYLEFEYIAANTHAGLEHARTSEQSAKRRRDTRMQQMEQIAPAKRARAGKENKRESMMMSNKTENGT